MGLTRVLSWPGAISRTACGKAVSRAIPVGENYIDYIGAVKPSTGARLAQWFPTPEITAETL